MLKDSPTESHYPTKQPLIQSNNEGSCSMRRSVLVILTLTRHYRDIRELIIQELNV